MVNPCFLLSEFGANNILPWGFIIFQFIRCIFTPHLAWWGPVWFQGLLLPHQCRGGGYWWISSIHNLFNVFSLSLKFCRFPCNCWTLFCFYRSYWLGPWPFLCDLVNGFHVFNFSGFLCFLGNYVRVTTLKSPCWFINFLIFLRCTRQLSFLSI